MRSGVDNAWPLLIKGTATMVDAVLLVILLILQTFWRSSGEMTKGGATGYHPRLRLISTEFQEILSNCWHARFKRKSNGDGKSVSNTGDIVYPPFKLASQRGRDIDSVLREIQCSNIASSVSLYIRYLCTTVQLSSFLEKGFISRCVKSTNSLSKLYF